MAKKQHEKDKQRHKQRRRERQEEDAAKKGLEALKRKVQSQVLFSDKEVVFQSGSPEKMSEILEAFVQPYLEYAETRKSYEKLIAVAAVAWNAALFPPEERQTMLDETSKIIQTSGGNKEDVEIYRGLVNELIKRKERYFADNKRLIVSYQISETRGGFHLLVASTM
ncbi:MAG: hypothetical protein M1358_13825 [Chloroflexi bacterium]|nr:hypothetical protein [Chloroflexota bacterium]